MEIMHRLQQSTSTGTCTCVGVGTSVGTCIGIGTGTFLGAGVGTSDQDAGCHLTTHGLVRFRDMIYVPNCSELKNIILRKFHIKSYSGYPGYHKTLTIVKKFYHWPNLKK